jgi:hypothetical protein
MNRCGEKKRTRCDGDGDDCSVELEGRDVRLRQRQGDVGGSEGGDQERRSRRREEG